MLPWFLYNNFQIPWPIQLSGLGFQFNVLSTQIFIDFVVDVQGSSLWRCADFDFSRCMFGLGSLISVCLLAKVLLSDATKHGFLCKFWNFLFLFCLIPTFGQS